MSKLLLPWPLGQRGRGDALRGLLGFTLMERGEKVSSLSAQARGCWIDSISGQYGQIVFFFSLFLSMLQMAELAGGVL